MFVVTGATGNTGSIVAHTLLEAGRPVRLLVRDPKKVEELAARGAEVVQGDLWEEAALARALTGAAGVYLVSPPEMKASNFIAQRRAQLLGATRAARAAGVGHVVFLSSIGAHRQTGTGPVRTVHDGEQALRATGLPVTFVRAAYFMENWATVIPVAKQDGVLPSFIAARQPIATVSTRDIGAVGARALLEGPRGTRVIELAGPSEASPSDVADVLGRLLGRSVAVAEGPLEAVIPTFQSFGFSENLAALYADLYLGIRNGTLDWETRGTEAIRGSTTLEQALKARLG
jgi:uncharacterized protein YbjT (DUF2867 family)